jgi:hypothetical protein
MGHPAFPQGLKPRPFKTCAYIPTLRGGAAKDGAPGLLVVVLTPPCAVKLGHPEGWEVPVTI